MNIPAAVFKAECLKLMDEVARTGEPIVITKHGRPVAQLVPAPVPPGSLFGYMKHTVTMKRGVEPSPPRWSAESGDEDHLYLPLRKKPRTRRAARKQ